MNDQTKKKDAGKVRLELTDSDADEGLARVLTFGAEKYVPDGWRAGMEWRRLIGAARRHLAAFSKGEDIDPESGLPHIDHLACCVHFLSAYQKQGGGTDDRYKPPAPIVLGDPLDNYAKASHDANGSPVEPPKQCRWMLGRHGAWCDLQHYERGLYCAYHEACLARDEVDAGAAPPF